MSILKKGDDQEASKFDKFFEETLERMRPYILALSDPSDSELCQVWLQKLSRASSQRPLRNHYLCELSRHLKSGHIGGIFSKPPQNGQLLPLQQLRDHMVEKSSSSSELSDTSGSVPHKATTTIMKHRNKIGSDYPSTDSVSSTDCNRTIAGSTTGCYQEKLISHKNPRLYVQRIEELTAVIHELRSEKERLKQDVSYFRENCNDKGNSENFLATIDQLTGEITMLKTKVLEVQNMKDMLEKNHQEIVDQYQRTMTKQYNELNERLREAHCENMELNEKVSTMNCQLEKAKREKKEEINTIEQNYKEQLENTRIHYETLLIERNKQVQLKDDIIVKKETKLAALALEDKLGKDEITLLKDKNQELEGKLQTKIQDEGKLHSFLKEQCSSIKEEFMKMRNDMEIATRTENQSLFDKTCSLKKDIMKLVKSKKKLSIEFENKISHVLKAKELEIQSLQLQLQEQHSELSSNLSAEKQCEFDTFVGLLEKRYKELLAATDASACKQRKNLLKKITLLEGQMTSMENSLADGDDIIV